MSIFFVEYCDFLQEDVEKHLCYNLVTVRVCSNFRNGPYDAYYAITVVLSLVKAALPF